jgi:hypothetical protein
MGDRQLKPGGGNPKGHFEDYDMVQLNHHLVNRADPGSRCPTGLIATEKFRAYVAFRDDTQAVWGVKDPRLCVTGPLLLEQLKNRADDVRIVIAARDVGACIKSLAVRDNLDLGTAAVNFMFRETEMGWTVKIAKKYGMPIHRVQFEELVDPDLRDLVVFNLADFIFNFTAGIANACQFVDPTLVHHGEESQ